MSIPAPRRNIIECASPTSPRKSYYTPTSPVLRGVTKCQRAEIQQRGTVVTRFEWEMAEHDTARRTSVEKHAVRYSFEGRKDRHAGRSRMEGK
jgi:hypothetical protein